MSSSTFTSQTYNVPVDNIDTDQIIPARFLTTTEREGMGRFLFYNWRYHQDDSPRANHALSGFDKARHGVLVAGANFGCGSSREHAPWALLDYGVRAVISSRFADIFRGNSLKNGLLPITVEQDVIDFLLANPDSEVSVDISGKTVDIAGFGEVSFPLDPFSAYCLTRGIDQLDFILEHEEDIRRHEQQR